MLPTALDSVHRVAATIGFVSFAALWAGTLWGSVLRSGWAAARLKQQTVHGIHMHLILLGLTLGIVHGLVQVAAPGGKVRWIDTVVPFLDRPDPLGVGFGVLSLELMIATALSVLIQRKLGWHRWRALHSLGYLSFTLVAAHMMISGSEVATAGIRTVIAAAWGCVILAGASTITPVARMPRALLERVARRHRAEELTVAVDAGRCASFGFCEQEAPAIFALRSDRRLAYRSVVSSDQAEAAMRAATVCPARAIALGRMPTSVVLAQPAGEDEQQEQDLARLLETTPPPGVRAVGDTSPGLRPVPPAPTHTPSGLRADPTHTNPGRVADPIRRVNPGRAADPLHHTNPGRVAEPVHHTNPGRIAEPIRRVNPGRAADPVHHTNPGRVAEPMHHTNPGRVADPVHHTNPGRVAEPVHHTNPGIAVPVGATRAGSVSRLRPVAAPLPRHDPPERDDSPGPLRPAAAQRAAAGRTGAQRAAAGRAAVGRTAADRFAGPPAAEDPPSQPLPPPSDLADTGRHHLPPLRGIPGGRSGR